MASRLSDEELRKSLREFGEDVGPITPTTRSTWERRLGALRRARGPLNAFSSDDSEVESPSGARKKRTHRPNHSSPPDSDIFKKPAAINVPIRPHRTLNSSNRKASKKNSSRNSTFEVETSDSELDTSESSTPRLNRRPLASFFPSEGGQIFRRSFNSTSTPNSHSFTPTLERLKKAPSSNGFLPPPPEEVREQGRSTEYSHCISWLLLAGTVVFFVVIGLLYMSEVQKNTPNTHYTKFCSDVTEDQCKPLILVSRELHYLLTMVAGDYECGFSKTRNMSVLEAKVAMRDLVSADSNFKMEQFDEIFNHSLLLFWKNPKWGVKCLTLESPSSSSNEELSVDGMEWVSALEAEQGAKSLWCRARLSLQLTLNRLFVAAAVCCACGVSWLCWVLWKRRREAQEKLFYEMVEQVIDILRDPSSDDPQMTNCKAVVNVRDALIPPQERRSRMWLWDRVVQFIEENESRVSVEYHKINGEDFKVWRWNTCTTESEGGKQGKVWQGQAFSCPGKGKSMPFNPTPCLKIRNMFDPEVEYGDDWQVSVRDAILEKCEGNDGIIHIAFDTATNNEGCVYMMCSSTEAAGKAYNDLHGWWFDGKLVTVKYLKRSRYLDRFPSAASSPLPPLRPSNDKRLSLSAPFFSSALERS